MRNKIKQLIKERDTNPHVISKQTGLTYRVVLRLQNQAVIKRTTPIGTLLDIATALDVPVTDLYDLEVENKTA